MPELVTVSRARRRCSRRRGTSARLGVVAAIRAGELLKDGVIADEAASKKREPGMTVVVLPPNGGEPRVAHQSPMPVRCRSEIMERLRKSAAL
jgi:hypothetical protein